MSIEECRLCGKMNPMRKKLSDRIKGFLSFKEFVEYFCRIELDDDDTTNNLPKYACQECYSTLLNFCMFTVNVEKQQNKFKNRLPQQISDMSAVKRKIDTLDENEDSNNNDEEKSFSNVKPKSETFESSKKKRMDHTLEEKRIERHDNCLADCLQGVKLVFKNEISSREKQYEKVTIKESLLLDGGEIPTSWLKRYKDFTTWQDFSYQCFHCNKQIKSLCGLLKHFDDVKIPLAKRIIKCSCEKIFKDAVFLTSYLNHVSKNHYTHLKFTCIFCSKVFVNVVKLSNHIECSHGKSSIRNYQCYDCGLNCSSFERLKTHKNCHDI